MSKPDPFDAAKKARRTRINARLPVTVNGVKGLTRDISTTGLFIVQTSQHEMGSRIDFWVDMDTPEGRVKLCCEGEVMRIEDVDGKIGIGVKILSQVRKSYA